MFTRLAPPTYSRNIHTILTHQVNDHWEKDYPFDMMPKSKACVLSLQNSTSVENSSPSAVSCDEQPTASVGYPPNAPAGTSTSPFPKRRQWPNRRKRTLSKRPSRESTRRRRRRRSTRRRRRRTAAAGCSPGRARPRLPSAARLPTRRGGRRRSPARRRGGKRSSPSSSTSSSTATVVRTGKGTNLVTTLTPMAVAMATVPTENTAVRTATPRRTLNRVPSPPPYIRTGQLCIRNRHGFVPRR
ncbi:unnamed protein product [Ectocarpus sp. 13 AM-2016]